MKLHLKEVEGREHRADEQKPDIRRDYKWVESAREDKDLFIKT